MTTVTNTVILVGLILVMIIYFIGMIFWTVRDWDFISTDFKVYRITTSILVAVFIIGLYICLFLV
jgi:hypothetical protein